jgi:GTP pyrophosphokinase
MRLQEILDENPKTALKFAAHAHRGQQRAGGEPYIAHPVRVAKIVQKYKQSHNIFFIKV